jgi:pyrimidine operon attenuation protein/uracil phosphoribosyltransferase
MLLIAANEASMSEGRETILMDAQKVDRMVARLARQIQEPEDAQGGVFLLGIRRGGEALARRLAAEIAKNAEKPGLGFLNVNLYRDDDLVRTLPDSDIYENLTDKLIVLVDDVLFTGRTVRAALDAVTDLGRPRAIRLAVLIDRGLRELPIQGDYVGSFVPTSREESVKVHLSSTYAQSDCVILRGNGDAS